MASNSEKTGLHKPISSIFEGVPMPTRKVAPRVPVVPSVRPAVRPTTPNPIADMPREFTHSAAHSPAESAVSTQPAASALTAPAPVSAPPHRPQAVPEPKAVTRPRRSTLFAGLKARLFRPKTGVGAARQKTMVLLVPVLAVALVFILVKVLGTTPRKSRAKDKAPDTASAAADISILWELPEPYPVGLRDPMTFAARQEPAPPLNIEPDELDGSPATPTPAPAAGHQFELKGVLISDNPCAIIGTRILREADTVDGATIVKITNGAVTFERDGRTWTQTVNP